MRSDHLDGTGTSLLFALVKPLGRGLHTVNVSFQSSWPDHPLALGHRRHPAVPGVPRHSHPHHAAVSPGHRCSEAAASSHHDAGDCHSAASRLKNSQPLSKNECVIEILFRSVVNASPTEAHLQPRHTSGCGNRGAHCCHQHRAVDDDNR